MLCWDFKSKLLFSRLPMDLSFLFRKQKDDGQYSLKQWFPCSMWTPKTAFLQSWFTCRCNQPSQAVLPICQNPCLKPCQWPRNQVLGNLESILSSSMVYHRHVSRSILLYIDTSAFSTHTYILLAMVSNQLTFPTISTYSQSSLG